MSEERIKAKVLEGFGARITVFENGDVYVSTCGDVHILARRNLFDEAGCLWAKPIPTGPRDDSTDAEEMC
jgi:hypothetical protein